MALITTNYVSVFLLSVLLALALDSTWGFIFRNGYYDALVRLRDIGPHLLPGSNTPLQKRYTGIGPIDYWLTVLQAVFANIFDGSAPSLSIYAFHFAGQLVPVIVTMYIESSREGNQRNVMSLFFAWASLMQSPGYGIIMPVYCGAHVLISPTALSDPFLLQNSIRPRDDLALITLPWSILFGYILPAVMMSLPYFSPKVHQYLVAVWQVFPVWIVALQYIFSKASCLLPSPQTMKIKTGHLRAVDLESLDRLYRFAFALASLTHCTSLGLIALMQWFPDLIAASNGLHVTYKEVFLPPNIWTGAQVSDMVQGAHGFFQYDQYVGSIAAIIWAFTLHYNTYNKSLSVRQWAQLTFEIVGYSVVAGPTGALTMLLWKRDLQVMDAEAHVNGAKMDDQRHRLEPDSRTLER